MHFNLSWLITQITQRFIARLVISVNTRWAPRTSVADGTVAVGLRWDMQLTSSRTSCIKVIAKRDVASSSVGVFKSMISMASKNVVTSVNANRHSAQRFYLPVFSCLLSFCRSLYAIRIDDRLFILSFINVSSKQSFLHSSSDVGKPFINRRCSYLTKIDSKNIFYSLSTV